jgi:nanoRNase/pAp phosphatase (c-di-AMP/oligoRNAs hydrolase)
MISEEILKEMSGNVATRGDFLMLNVEFIDGDELRLLPKVVDRLLEMKGVSTALVYGIKDGMVYLVGKSRRRANLASKIQKAFPELGRVKEVNGYTLAMIPLGMLGYFQSQEKVLRVVDELMNDTLAGGKATRGFGTVYDRVAEIKNLINMPLHRQGVVL